MAQIFIEAGKDLETVECVDASSHQANLTELLSMLTRKRQSTPSTSTTYASRLRRPFENSRPFIHHGHQQHHLLVGKRWVVERLESTMNTNNRWVANLHVQVASRSFTKARKNLSTLVARAAANFTNGQWSHRYYLMDFRPVVA